MQRLCLVHDCDQTSRETMPVATDARPLLARAALGVFSLRGDAVGAGSLNLLNDGLAVGETFSFELRRFDQGGGLIASIERWVDDEAECAALKPFLDRRAEQLCALLLPGFVFAPHVLEAYEQLFVDDGRHYKLAPPRLSVKGRGLHLAYLAGGGDLAAALKALQAYQLETLVLKFAPRVLADHEIQKLRAASMVADEHERALIDAWIVAQRGLTISANISTARPLDAAALRLCRNALFGATRPAASSINNDTLDLSDAWPAGLLWPRLLPRASDLLPSPRQVRTGPNVSGVRLGVGAFGGAVCLADVDRARHLYVVGATGTGKSTLLGAMVRADAEAGQGLILIDPHGDLARSLRWSLPAARAADVVWCDVTAPDSAIGIDLLAGCGGDAGVAREFVVNELIALIKNVLYAGVPEAFGPAFELYFRNTLLLLIEGSETPSLLDFVRVMTDSAFRRELLSRCNDQVVCEFWQHVASAASGEQSLENFVPYVSCKLAQFTGNAITRRMLSRDAQTLDFRAAMDERKIVLVTLEKGIVGGYNASFLGALIAMRLVLAAMGRSALPPDQRTPCRVYVDEFQTLAGASLAEALAEARKFGLSLTLANQSLYQIGGGVQGVGAAALANCANLIAFRTGAPDAALLAPWFSPEFSNVDLMRLPNFQAAARLLTAGEIDPPRLIRTTS